MIAGGRPNLIGISGKMGSGKDTLSLIINYIADNFAPESIADWEQPVGEFTYKNKKYSEKLKYMVCFLIGCTRSDLEDREFKETELGEEWNGLTPRKLMQLLGTEAGRQIIHPNIWVNALFADYKSGYVEQGVGWIETEDDYPNWIITDVRFPNEAQAIKDRGGIMIRVNRNKQCGSCENHFTSKGDCPHCESGNWVHGNIDSDHASETALDDYDGFDYVIENDSDSMLDLVNLVRELKIV